MKTRNFDLWISTEPNDTSAFDNDFVDKVIASFTEMFYEKMEKWIYSEHYMNSQDISTPSFAQMMSVYDYFDDSPQQVAMEIETFWKMVNVMRYQLKLQKKREKVAQ
jgi:hypothetical protein